MIQVKGVQDLNVHKATVDALATFLTSRADEKGRLVVEVERQTSIFGVRYQLTAVYVAHPLCIMIASGANSDLQLLLATVLEKLEKSYTELKAEEQKGLNSFSPYLRAV